MESRQTLDGVAGRSFPLVILLRRAACSLVSLRGPAARQRHAVSAAACLSCWTRSLRVLPAFHRAPALLSPSLVEGRFITKSHNGALFWLGVVERSLVFSRNVPSCRSWTLLPLHTSPSLSLLVPLVPTVSLKVAHHILVFRDSRVMIRPSVLFLPAACFLSR